MPKIAVYLDTDRNILKINDTNEEAAIKQSKLPGWILSMSNSDFSIIEKQKWTIRESDNALVHFSSNQTPEEEKNTVITELTLQNLTQSNEIEELKKISTAQTLQSLQDAKDKEEQQKVITNLTVQILKLQQTNSSTDSVEK